MTFNPHAVAAQHAYESGNPSVPTMAASDFNVRDAAMGHAIALNSCANLKATIEEAQIIEHYLRWGDFKEAPTATEEENT